jgi:hypothetical protein
MRRSMRAMVGAGVMAAATILPLAATATAHATPEDTATTAAAWRRAGPFSSYAACERARDTQAGLGRPTRPCYYLECGTAPNCLNGYYYDIYR